jgi:LRV protein FeS4 cluster
MPDRMHLREAPRADCAACPHRGTLLAARRYEPGDTCLMAESGRRIDRFLCRNPEFAEENLADPFRERCAIAVRYAPARAALALVRDRVCRILEDTSIGERDVP